MHVPRGISRHVVRFVEAGGEVFAIKEATDRFVLREHGLLRELADHNVSVVEAYGTVIDRVSDEGEELGGLLITRHLQFSQPYRSLFTGRDLPELRIRLLDALAGLFVRLHLAGFYWGDCSLSNTLFRRDAGALAAYLVDAETGELHPRLSAGQREHDLDDRDREHRRRAVRPAGRRAARRGRRRRRPRRPGPLPLRVAVAGADPRRGHPAAARATASTSGCGGSTTSASTSAR